MKHYKTSHKILVCLLPFVSAVLIYFLATFVINYITFPPCLLYKVTGIYCPSCGITRAVEALLSGDILLSVRQNGFLFIYIFCVLWIYLELFVKIVLEKKFKFSILKLKFLYALLIILGIYTVLRNIFPVLAPL